MKTRKLYFKISLILIMAIGVTIINQSNYTNFVNKNNVLLIYGLLLSSFIALFFIKDKAKLRNEIIDFLTFIINTFVFLLTITTFFIMPARVDGKSMLPTYEDGDRVFVNMYNIKIERDNVVVYKLDNELIIKRVVAVKGDIISIEKVENENEYYLKINDEIYLNEYDQHYIMKANNKLYQQIVDNDNNELILEEGQFILLGDNALNSSDSRNSGISTFDKMVGKVMGGLFG
ncbi:MAG TPA: signal peptidase I [Acholeplasma sp.]|nr:signal peptidase I [Acholeplasma sp.]